MGSDLKKGESGGGAYVVDQLGSPPEVEQRSGCQARAQLAVIGVRWLQLKEQEERNQTVDFKK